MRFKLFSIIYLAIASVSIGIAFSQLPAYASRLPWLLLVFLIDIYFLQVVTRKPSQLRGYAKALILIPVFLPSLLLVGFLTSTIFLSPVEWNHTLRTYLIGIAVFFYALRAPQLIVFLCNSLILFLKKPTAVSFFTAPTKWWVGFSFLISIVVGAVMTIGMTKSVYHFQVIEQKIHVNDLPESFHEFRIVHISDLHLGRWHSGKPLENAFEMINTLKPDLIVITGDIVNYATAEALPFKGLLAALDAKHGVYAVLGNHDYGDYLRWKKPELKQQNIEDMYMLMEEIGWTLLENKHEIIKIGEDCLVVAGVSHYSTKRYIPDRMSLQQTLGGIPDPGTTILLSHNPQVIDRVKDFDRHVDIVLAGHTHALQVGLRLGNKEFSPASLIYRYWGGLYEFDVSTGKKLSLYVNRGLGHMMVPMRIGILPEITVIELAGL